MHSIRKRIWRKKGSREGIRNSLQTRGSKLRLPAFTLSNVRLLRNKWMNSLHWSNLTLITITQVGFVSLKPGCLRTLQWAYLDLYSYALTGTPRKQIKKSIGGWLWVAINGRWANHTDHETVCWGHYEIAFCCHHNLPGEFTQLTVILACVPGPDNALAAERITNKYDNAVYGAPDQPSFCLGISTAVMSPRFSYSWSSKSQPQCNWTECSTYALEIYLSLMSPSPALPLGSQTIM